MRTPGSLTLQATNSLATRFIPSLRGVTRATSASLGVEYNFQVLWNIIVKI